MSAQQGLQIAGIFEECSRHPSKNQKLIIISGEMAQQYDLTLFKSLTVPYSKDMLTRMETALSADTRKSVGQLRETEGEHTYRLLVELSPRGNIHRFIFYMNTHCVGGKELILFYFEGPTTLHRIMKMIELQPIN